MKEIETIVTKYIANDGTRFDDKKSCEKHEELCKKREDDFANRIAMIKEKRKSLDDEFAEKQRLEKIEYEKRVNDIKAIGSRISALISVANELIDNNMFPNFGYKRTFLNKYGYEYGNKISFRTDTLDGFELGAHTYKYISYIGTNGLGLIGTNGSDIKYEPYGSGVYGANKMLGWILKDFDRFEEAFYKLVDEICKSENEK